LKLNWMYWSIIRLHFNCGKRNNDKNSKNRQKILDPDEKKDIEGTYLLKLLFLVLWTALNRWWEASILTIKIIYTLYSNLKDTQKNIEAKIAQFHSHLLFKKINYINVRICSFGLFSFKLDFFGQLNLKQSL